MRCRVLTGWDDERMTESKLCAVVARQRDSTYKIAVCDAHVKSNGQRGFTVVPKSGPMIGIGKGTRFEDI